VELGEVATFTQGTQVPVDEQLIEKRDGYVRFIRILDYTQETTDIRWIKDNPLNAKATLDDLIMVRYGASAGFIGKGLEGVFANNLFRINFNPRQFLGDFLYYIFKGQLFQDFVRINVMQAAMPALSHSIMKGFLIPLPPLSEQKQIVEQIEIEQKIVSENKKLIEIFQNKISDTISALWGR
jgi:type I restriction enzyme S subunit